MDRHFYPIHLAYVVRKIVFNLSVQYQENAGSKNVDFL